MAVYVDDMRAPYGRMLMCHMIANSLDELHAMADRIGVQRRWFQAPPKASAPHYDIALSKRALAIRAGARAITWRECAAMSMLANAGQPMGDPRTAPDRYKALRKLRMEHRNGHEE